MKLINPIKDAMVALPKANASTLGLKTVAKDITLDNIADEVDKLVASFPAAIVVYYGRRGITEGTVKRMARSYAVIIATRSVQAPNASDPIASDLCDPIFELFQGQTLVPALQRSWLDFTDEALQHKDKVWTLYRQLYDTEVAVDFRDALRANSNPV